MLMFSIRLNPRLMRVNSVDIVMMVTIAVRGAVLAYAYQVHSQHIEAGDDQGRECQDCRLEVEYRIVGMGEQLYAEHAEYQSDGERPGVAHEYFGVFLHISEHVVIEEWAEHSERG